LEGGGFAGLAWREKHDVLANFDAVDEIRGLLGAWHNIIFLRIHTALGAKTSHVLLLVVNILSSYCITSLSESPSLISDVQRHSVVHALVP